MDITISEQILTKIKEQFNKIDKKNGQEIPLKELTNVFQEIGHTLKAEQAIKWQDDIERNDNGNVTFDVFVSLLKRKMNQDQEEAELRHAFRMLANKRNQIDVEDLRFILRSLGDDLSEEEIEDMITETDKDGSGEVDFNEFYSIMRGD